MERNIRLLIEYDGSRYDGWQRLGKGHGVTIQGKLEDVLSKMTGEQVELIGAGRTDAGVHAYEQVANFHTNSNMKCWEMKYYLNRYLPGDIAVNRVDDVPERFHSRYNAKAKKYLYRIAIGDVPCVFDRKYVTVVSDSLDVEAMRRAASYLTGTHDFKAFTSAKRGKKSTVRTIESIEITECGKELRFVFRGDGFLYHMVRILVGTLLEVGKGERKAEELPSVIDKGQRESAGALVPAGGLTLVEVRY